MILELLQATLTQDYRNLKKGETIYMHNSKKCYVKPYEKCCGNYSYIIVPLEYGEDLKRVEIPKHKIHKKDERLIREI